MGEISQNTNLVSEFYVLSMLHRIGAGASLTLGNKKSVDIVVEKDGLILTIDVKGLRDTSSFPIDNWTKKDKTHFLVFVSFLNKIEDPLLVPEIYVIPANELEQKKDELVYINPKGNRKVVNLGALRKFGMNYKNKWDYFI
jgi:hypothetical protein